MSATQLAKLTNKTATMTSLEISELVESQHGNVCISIKRLAKRSIIQLPPMQKVHNNRALSPNNRADMFVFSGEQGKRDSIIVVAQLSPEFTARLVDRWQELENSSQRQIPQNYSEALRLAAELHDQAAENRARLQIVEPKATALDRLATAEGSMCITSGAKHLQVRPKDLTNFLYSRRWIYRRAENGRWTGYQDKIQQGLLEHKTVMIWSSDGAEKMREQVRITAKGMAKIATLLDTTTTEEV